MAKEQLLVLAEHPDDEIIAAGSANLEIAVLPPEHPLAAKARTIYKGRRAREALFGPKLFADPAWDVLLDLFIAESCRRPVSVSSVAIAAAVPVSTALRAISRLVERKLVRRLPDPLDHRRVFLHLTDRGRALTQEAIVSS